MGYYGYCCSNSGPEELGLNKYEERDLNKPKNLTNALKIYNNNGYANVTEIRQLAAGKIQSIVRGH